MSFFIAYSICHLLSSTIFHGSRMRINTGGKPYRNIATADNAPENIR
jgi:hypothetical protein